MYLVIALLSGIIVVDHLSPVIIQHLAVLDERSYQERFGSMHRSRTTQGTINAIVLKLSDGTVLQLSSLGDFISTGDTIELQRTPLLKDPLQYRKINSRAHNWLLVDSNKLDYQIYPYLVFICSFLLLFPWSGDNFRWSLQAGLGLMLVCWLVVTVGTGGLARLMGWF
ncbi:MAG: hypothetical protein ABI432_11160 [Flavobacteriales bacterium]